MRIGNIIRTGILGTIIGCSTFSCKKAPYRLVDRDTVPSYITQKLDMIHYRGMRILRDTAYKFYGYDTLKIRPGNTIDIMQEFNEQAIKNTPKIKVGKHLEMQMIPKRGGGFYQIPVWKNDYEPSYTNQKAILKSKEIYTRDNNDFYIPVEYYGIPNPKAISAK